jgi:hypothetical protein
MAAAQPIETSSTRARKSTATDAATIAAAAIFSTRRTTSARGSRPAQTGTAYKGVASIAGTGEKRERTRPRSRCRKYGTSPVARNLRFAASSYRKPNSSRSKSPSRKMLNGRYRVGRGSESIQVGPGAT